MSGTGWAGSPTKGVTADQALRIQNPGYAADRSKATWFTPYTTNSSGGSIPDSQALKIWQAAGGAVNQPNQNKLTTTKRSSGGGGGRGGGGGGGAAAGLDQSQLDWYMNALKQGGPEALQYNALTMPQWNDVNISPFDTAQYDQLRQSLGQAVSADQATANTAYDNLTKYLGSNYSNPFSGATYATTQSAPGTTQAGMQRLLASQGMGNGAQQTNDLYRESQGADQAFGNLLSLLGANSDQAQQNRLNNVLMDRGTTANALNMAQLQGNTAIGQQQAQAKSAWQQRADDRALQNAQTRYQSAQQEALANWQRQNTVGDTNVGNRNSYDQTVIGAIAALIPQLAGRGLSLPDLTALLQQGQTTNV